MVLIVAPPSTIASLLSSIPRMLTEIAAEGIVSLSGSLRMLNTAGLAPIDRLFSFPGVDLRIYCVAERMD
jgi:hypothetical protein